ncbi:DUF5689 domain-containing protein [uncultured Dokdonia sp.]|uniref:DUF5689 domain-containing protein n=1 Tax=uncultured Dokdonia sp. TaxID=575653 RepID=UPI0026370662|nr:DUF5689 domain-containing protein [uncultured Dokdonia sp.]
MKTIKLTQLFTMLVALVALVSCVQDDDFSVPELDAGVVEIEGQSVSISSVAGQVAQAADNGDEIFTFDGVDTFIEGYVISSDEGGNFFEEFIIQDSPENPVAGVRILIDVNPLFTTYEVGRKVFVRLDGLTAGISNGVLSIGIADGGSLGKIPAPIQNDVIVRSNEVAQIIPLPLAFSDFTNDKTNLFIALQDVQFSADEVINNQRTYASEPQDEFDGERVLEDCATGGRTILSTSTFSDFKALSLPAGRGTINGILTKDFFGEVFNIAINSPTDVVFAEGNRCDLCGLADERGSGVVFADNLSSGSLSPLWTNFAQEGSEVWGTFNAGGGFGTAANIGSFMSGDARTVTWLITPEIDFDAQEMETLNFETSNSFSDGSELTLLFADDWDGDTANIDDANWRPILEGTIVSDDTFFQDWVASGNIDLSCIEGTAHIAFKYVGSGEEDFDGTFELDNFAINSADDGGNNGGGSVDCGTASSAGATVLFEDFFETQSNNQPISGNGWTNFQEAGTQEWSAFSSTGQNPSLGISARVGSFMSGDASTISWLVTPEIDLDAQDGETLQFMTSNSFADGSTLELLFSSDWDGVPANIPTATWEAIPAGIIVSDSDDFAAWFDSGIVDLSCIDGSGYIAFKYVGSGDANSDGTYELDEIQINAQ